MRNKFIVLATVMAFGVAACATGGGYGGGGTRLSSCMRNAFIGAGIGAVAGAVQGSEDNRGENAAIGAAVGGAATFGVCKYLDSQQQARIENAYQRALAQNSAVNEGWIGASSRQYILAVQRPQTTPGQSNCRSVNATLNVSNQGAQSLPMETYCNNGGGWVPVA